MADRTRRTIESNVRRLRAARGWSLVTLAGLARVTLRAASQADRGDVLSLRLETLLRIANALDATVAEVWPLLGPIQRETASAREKRVQGGIAELDAERARRREALAGSDLASA